MKKIIIVNGTARSGKDTLVNMCIENIKEKYNIIPLNVSTKDEIETLLYYAGWDGMKDDTYRQAVCTIKQQVNKVCDIDIATVRKSLKTHDMVFIHVRECESIDNIVKEYGDECLKLLVKKDLRIPENDADNDVYNTVYDIIIENNGTLNELQSSSNILCETIFNSVFDE